jgi:hypothetical protein
MHFYPLNNLANFHVEAPAIYQKLLLLIIYRQLVGTMQGAGESKAIVTTILLQQRW